MALAHGEENEIRGAYNSALYLNPRRRMLQDWADMIQAMLAPPQAANDRDQSEGASADADAYSPLRVDALGRRSLP